jgi:hypothetical protein
LVAISRKLTLGQGLNITAEESSFQTPDFSIKTPYSNTSLIYVSYTLTKSALVNMVVYSFKGQTIKTIMNDFKCAGIHTQTLSADGFPSGTYLMKFANNKQLAVKKFHLFK